MQNKIPWYEEILAQDPGSLLFYPLAQLYREQGELDKAVQCLQSGLSKHPSHAQARLLLIQTLAAQDRMQESKAQVKTLLPALESCPQFWLLWAESLQEQGQMDMAVAVRFIGARLMSSSVSWAQVVDKGLGSLLADQQGQPTNEEQGTEPIPETAPQAAAPIPEQDQSIAESASILDREEEEAFQILEADNEKAPTPEGPKPERNQFRTLTMADILASQGDLPGALDIYQELRDLESDPERVQQIQDKIDRVQERMRTEPAPDISGDSSDFSEEREQKKHQLLRRLDRLAARLEAKGANKEGTL